MSKKCDWLDISSLVISGVHTIVQQCNSVPTWRRCCIADHSEKQLKKVELIFFLCVIPFHMWEEHSAHTDIVLLFFFNTSTQQYWNQKRWKSHSTLTDHRSQQRRKTRAESVKVGTCYSEHLSVFANSVSFSIHTHITKRNILKSTNWNNGISLTGPPQPSTPDQTDLIHDDIWFGNGRSHAQGSSCFQPLRTSSSHARTTPEGKQFS